MKNEIQTQFFYDYKKCYFNFREKIKVNENKDFTKKEVECFVKKMMAKIVFIKFIQEKGWVNNGDKNYLSNVFDNSRFKDNFFNEVLRKLFCQINIKQEKNSLPYLNCAFFDEEKFDNYNIIFPSSCFKDFFDLFKKYEFSTDEYHEKNENKITPESLSYVFENLLEDNKDKGAFYTPKEIVQYMCEESLIAYLGDTEANRKLVKDFDVADITDKKSLLEKLEDVKICDPAIGSGAFPMGMLNILYRIRLILEGKEFTSGNIVKVKKNIIKNNIYGVDIEDGAVDIARLRFWLSIVVDEDKPIPLPNLDYKIMQGNSLLEQYKGVDLKLDLLATDKKGKKVNSQVIDRQMCFALDDETSALENLKATMNDFFEPDASANKLSLRVAIDNSVKNYIKTKCGNVPSVNAVVDTMDLNNKPFFLWHLYFADVFVKKGGFDIVIGNPPYLKEGRISTKNLFAQYKDNPYYEGKMDLWQIFACQGIDMLNPAGHLCFIATNNWITNSGAKKMRNKIISDAQIKQMIDFGTYMIFKDSASIQTMIMLFGKNSKIDNYAFDWRFLNAGATKADMKELLLHTNNQFTVYKKPIINRKSLKNKLMTFSGIDDLLEKIEFCKTYLEDTEIAQGIVPNPDVVNAKNINKISSDKRQKHKIQINDGVFVIPIHFFQHLSDIEKEYIKPLFEPCDLQRYFVNENQKEIIYITHNNCSDSIPTLVSHLEKFREIMDDRRENRNGRLQFYHLHWPRISTMFEPGEKILSVRKCSSPCFSYTENSAYVMMACNVIKTNRFNMKFLTGLLNSKLIAYWLKHRGKMQGNNYQVDKEPLLGIPLVKPSTDDQKRLADLVDQILQLKEQNIDADINKLEQQIDDIVYSLYGLTQEEISIVDESLKKSVATEGKKKKSKKASADISEACGQ